MEGRERKSKKKDFDHKKDIRYKPFPKRLKVFRYNEWTTCAPLAAKKGERARANQANLGQYNRMTT